MEVYIADTANHVIRKISNGTITTIAGTGFPSFSGDGPNGEVYIADSGNNRIRKISTNGIISTVAGNGISGFSGDGDHATSAQLSNPVGIAVSSFGVIYISDSNNNRIRRVGLDGNIITIAGTGIGSFSGDGGDPINATFNAPYELSLSGQFLYIADSSNDRIRMITLPNSCNGLIYNDPKVCSGRALRMGCVCASNYYGDLCDITKCSNIFSNNNLVCSGNGKCTQKDICACKSGWFGSTCSLMSVITTIAGTGSPTFSVASGALGTTIRVSGPKGVAVSSNGDVYVADSDNNRICDCCKWNNVYNCRNRFQVI